MKKKLFASIIVGGGLALSLFFGTVEAASCPVEPQLIELKKEFSEAQTRLEKAEAKKAELDAKKADLNQGRKNAAEQVYEISVKKDPETGLTKIGALRAEVEKLKNDPQKTKADKKRLADLEAELEAMESQLAVAEQYAKDNRASIKKIEAELATVRDEIRKERAIVKSDLPARIEALEKEKAELIKQLQEKMAEKVNLDKKRADWNEARKIAAETAYQIGTKKDSKTGLTKIGALRAEVEKLKNDPQKTKADKYKLADLEAELEVMESKLASAEQYSKDARAAIKKIDARLAVLRNEIRALRACLPADMVPVPPVASEDSNVPTPPTVEDNTTPSNPSRPDETQGEAPRPDETQGEQTRPDETQGEQTRPDETQGEQTRPSETQGEQTRPSETKGETTKPSETKDETVKPAAATKTESKNPQTGDAGVALLVTSMVASAAGYVGLRKRNK